MAEYIYIVIDERNTGCSHIIGAATDLDTALDLASAEFTRLVTHYKERGYKLNVLTENWNTDVWIARVMDGVPWSRKALMLKDVLAGGFDKR